MNEVQKANIIARLGPVALTRYGIAIAIGAAVWYICALLIRRVRYRKSISVKGVSAAAAWMLALGALFSRLVYCAVQYDTFLLDGDGLKHILFLWEGGHSFSGAMVGAFGGMLIGSATSGVRPGRMANCFAPGLLPFAASAAVAQTCIGGGWGRVTDASWLAGTLAVVQDIYGESRYAVSRLQIPVYITLFLFLLLSCTERRHHTRWSMLGQAAAGYALFAMPFSSMLDGDVLRIGYVRIEQVFALLLLIAATGTYAVQLLRNHKPVQGILCILLLAAGAAIVAAMEFAVDREGMLETKYAIMFAGSLLAAHSAYIARAFMRSKRRRSARSASAS